jgi:hypothetical protein
LIPGNQPLIPGSGALIPAGNSVALPKVAAAGGARKVLMVRKI